MYEGINDNFAPLSAFMSCVCVYVCVCVSEYLCMYVYVCVHVLTEQLNFSILVFFCRQHHCSHRHRCRRRRPKILQLLRLTVLAAFSSV